MFNIKTVLAIAVMFLTCSAFAGSLGDFEGKSCAFIAKACAAAGYARDKQSKRFWLDCMKPVMLGQTVSGVKVDPRVVKDCRMHKMEQLKKELRDLQKSMGNEAQ